jgi:hypothetical protein
VDYGDGGGPQPVTLNPDNILNQSNKFDVGGNPNTAYTVTVKVTDKDTAVGTATFKVTVTNVAPTPSIAGAPASSLEGAALSLTGSATDPSTADTTAGFTYAWSVTKNGSPFGSGSSATGFSFTPDDNGTYIVTLKATDKDNGTGTTTATIMVTNAAPTVTITGPAPVGLVAAVNTTIKFTGTFTDPGTLDTHTADWLFWDKSQLAAPNQTSPNPYMTIGPVSGNLTEANGCGTVDLTGSFSKPGVYSVQLHVVDKDGGECVATTLNDDPAFNEFVVIYDPNGSFVTGGGWFNSPARAYKPDPTLVGKATFGFVSKYQKGANVPDGNTEFQFKEGNLNFKSTSYDWLVVTGSGKAQYKGSGTINGTGNYGFMLTAIDGDDKGAGGIDKLRIKIWDKATGVVVYDNQVTGDTSDSGIPNTALGGGSIVIH